MNQSASKQWPSNAGRERERKRERYQQLKTSRQFVPMQKEFRRWQERIRACRFVCQCVTSKHNALWLWACKMSGSMLYYPVGLSFKSWCRYIAHATQHYQDDSSIFYESLCFLSFYLFKCAVILDPDSVFLSWAGYKSVNFFLLVPSYPIITCQQTCSSFLFISHTVYQLTY